MREITVGRGEAFSTITAALQSVDDAQPLRLLIKNGVYNEKLFIERPYIAIIGESAEHTIITHADGAFDLHPDGTPNGTFRSYTMWLSGGEAVLENITVQNTCGDGERRGQGIALAVDATAASVKQVNLYACQDTLFTGPLPLHARIKDGFKGPSEHKPRTRSTQRYEACTIRGDVDFIFGGADAVFDRCRLIGNARNKEENGYFAAPSTPQGGDGYVFLHCSFECAQPHTFYLARPWRKYAKAAFVNCHCNDAIHPDVFHYWEQQEHPETVVFTRHNCK